VTSEARIPTRPANAESNQRQGAARILRFDERHAQAVGQHRVDSRQNRDGTARRRIADEARPIDAGSRQRRKHEPGRHLPAISRQPSHEQSRNALGRGNLGTEKLGEKHVVLARLREVRMGRKIANGVMEGARPICRIPREPSYWPEHGTSNGARLTLNNMEAGKGASQHPISIRFRLPQRGAVPPRAAARSAIRAFASPGQPCGSR